MMAESSGFRAQQLWVIVGILVGIAAQANWNEPALLSAPAEPTAPPVMLATTPFMNVTVHRVYDGDTIRIDLPHMPDVLGTNLGVRLFGIDAPEMRGSKCAVEKCLARGAREFLQDMIHRASNVELQDVKRVKYFRLIANVVLTDLGNTFDASSVLVDEGWAIPYFGGTKNVQYWCLSETQHSAALTEHVQQCERMLDIF